jgi:hypothetical protein
MTNSGRLLPQSGTMGEGFPSRESPGIRQARGLLALELERQAGDNEGRKKDRQKPLSSASEDDCLALRGIKILDSAGVPAIANLHGVRPRFDWYLGRGIHFERSGTLTINHDVVRSTPDFRSDRFVRQLECCGHLQPPSVTADRLVRSFAGHCVIRCLSGAVPWVPPGTPGRRAASAYWYWSYVGARSRVGKRHFQVYPRKGSLRAAASPLPVTRSRVPMGSEAQWHAGPTCHRQRCAPEL